MTLGYLLYSTVLCDIPHCSVLPKLEPWT